MLRSRKLISMVVVVIAVASMAIISVAAASNNGQANASAKSVTAASTPDAQAGQTKSAKLHDVSQNLGIDTTGMSDEQIQTAVDSAASPDTTPTAADYRDYLARQGVDTTGMTDGQLAQAANDSKTQSQTGQTKGSADTLTGASAKLYNIAQSFGISTTGMTDEQIQAAVASAAPADKETSAADFKDFLTRQDIDTTGMTDEQLAQAAFTSKILMCYNQNGTYDQDTKDAISQNLGIDTSSLTDTQITAALQAILKPAA